MWKADKQWGLGLFQCLLGYGTHSLGYTWGYGTHTTWDDKGIHTPAHRGEHTPTHKRVTQTGGEMLVNEVERFGLCGYGVFCFGYS